MPAYGNFPRAYVEHRALILACWNDPKWLESITICLWTMWYSYISLSSSKWTVWLVECVCSVWYMATVLCMQHHLASQHNAVQGYWINTFHFLFDLPRLPRRLHSLSILSLSTQSTQCVCSVCLVYIHVEGGGGVVGKFLFCFLLCYNKETCLLSIHHNFR